MEIFEICYLVAFTIASVIRSYFGLQFKRKKIVNSRKENPLVFLGICIWGVVLILPFISMFSSALLMADYEINASLRIFGVLMFVGSLIVLWRSHVDLAENFSPSLFIRNNHTLITTGIYQKIRHPMYLSFFMWAIGQTLLIDNWLAGPFGLIAFALIYLFRIEREEQQLVDRFGSEYRQYQKKTGRLLPPLLDD